jgi:hypothetical protein
MEIPDDLLVSEKGNTWLCDDDGNHVAWFKIEGRFVEVSVTPGNSPGFYLRLLTEKECCDEKIARHVNKNLRGWHVVRMNIAGIEVDSDGMVADKS